MISKVYAPSSELSSPKQRLKRPSMDKQVVDIVEVGEVGIYFDDPIRLDECDRYNEYATGIAGQEWLDFHPGDDVV